MERRDLLKSVTSLAASTSAIAQPAAPSSTKRLQSPDTIYRELGTTGETVSAIGLGAGTSACRTTRG